MADLNLTSFNPLFPMRIHQYNELFNDQNMNVMDKLNSVIDYLNQVGKLTNDVVKDWNTVYQWTMNDGLTTDVSNKIEQMKANGELQDLLNTIFNSLTGDMTQLQTVHKDTLVNAINDNVASLAQIVNQRIYASNYLKQGAETDDTARLQRFLNAATNGSTLIFELNKSYTVSSPLLLPSNLTNITIEGNNATLISNIPVNSNGASADPNQFTLLSDKVNQIKSNIVPTANITQGDTTLTFNSTDISTVQVGDMIVVNTSKLINALSSTYKSGSFRYVKSVSSTQLTLDGELETTLNISSDSVTVNVYRPLNNVLVKKLNFQLVNNGFQGGMWFHYVNGLIVKDCQFIGGGQQFFGLNTCGFNIRISNPTCNEFLDNSLSFGYGVLVSGHNIRVNKGTFYRCKHAIVGGASSFINTDIGYFHNYATDPQLCGFDAHGSCQKVTMVNNEVVNIGKSWAACGLWARGNDFAINGNIIRSAKVKTNTTYGIKTLDCAVSGISIIGNKIYDCDYGLKLDEVNAPLSDFTVMENQVFNALSDGFRTSKLYDSVVSKNRITANAQGMYFQGVANTDIEGNIVKYGVTAFGGGIFLDAYATGDSSSYIQITIRGNHLRSMGSSGTSPIRVKAGGYDNLIIRDNVVDNSGNAGAPVINISECTSLTKWIREKNIGDYIYSSLPSVAWTDRGRTILVQGNGTSTADTIYQCLMSATGTYSWKQIMAG